MSFLEIVHPQWLEVLEGEKESIRKIEDSLRGTQFSPKASAVMRALEYPLEEMKVVIFGQDPYPNPKHAMGLAFSVPSDTHPLPASLRNIFQELHADIGGELRRNGDLSDWSEQGVALINRVLTIPLDPSGVKGQSGGHINLGWQQITNAIAKELGRRNVVALLWGNYAQELRRYFRPNSIIASPHPSPLSAHRGFFGSRPFSRANQFLVETSLQEIDWLRR